MTANPIELIGGITTAGDVPKADVVSWAKARVSQVLASATELRDTVLAGQNAVFVRGLNNTYLIDTADTTTADDGLNCLISLDGKRFKILVPATSAANFDTVTDAAAATISVLVNFVKVAGYAAEGDGGAALYVRVASEPATPGKFSSADGAWWQLRANEVWPEMFGAAGDGVESSPGVWTGTDDKLALQAWAEFDAPFKSIGAKNYLTSESIDLLPNRKYRGVLNATKIVGISGGTFSTRLAPTLSSYVVGCRGSTDLVPITQIVTLALVPTSQSVDFSASLAGYSMVRGDIVIVQDRTDYSWSGWRSYYRSGEMLLFNSLTSNGAGADARLKTKNRVRDTYTAANLDGYVMRKAAIDIENIQVFGVTTTQAWDFSLLTSVRLRGVDAGGSTVQAGQFDRCFDINADIGGSMEAAEAGNQYVWVISNCTKYHLRFVGDSTRHAVATGGNDGDGCIPNRDGIIDGAWLLSTGSSSGGADAHGNSDNLVWRDCNIENGASFGGRDMRIKGGRILAADFGSGIAVKCSEVHSGIWSIEDVMIETYGNPSTFGIIDNQGGFGGTGSGGENSRGDMTLRLRGIHAVVSSLATEFIWLQNNSTTYKMNVDIDDVEITGGTAIADFVRYTGIASVAKASFIHIGNNIKGLRDSANILIFSGTTPADSTTHMLMPVQGGSVDLATANGTAATVASTITYKWGYPAEPVGQVSLDVATVSPYPGKGIEPKFYSKDGTTIRPGIYSHDGGNWTGIVSVTANWQVGPKIQGYG